MKFANFISMASVAYRMSICQTSFLALTTFMTGIIVTLRKSNSIGNSRIASANPTGKIREITNTFPFKLAVTGSIKDCVELLVCHASLKTVECQFHIPDDPIDCTCLIVTGGINPVKKTPARSGRNDCFPIEKCWRFVIRNLLT